MDTAEEFETFSEALEELLDNYHPKKEISTFSEQGKTYLEHIYEHPQATITVHRITNLPHNTNPYQIELTVEGQDQLRQEIIQSAHALYHKQLQSVVSQSE